MEKSKVRELLKSAEAPAEKKSTKKSGVKGTDQKFQRFIHKCLKDYNSKKSKDFKFHKVMVSQLNYILNNIGRCAASKANAISSEKLTITRRAVSFAIIKLIGMEHSVKFLRFGDTVTKKFKEMEKTKTSVADKLGLCIPPARVNKFLKIYGKRISYEATILLTAFLEYVMSAMISSAASYVTQNKKTTTISPRDVYMSIYGNEKPKDKCKMLKELFCKTRIQLSAVGVNPNEVEEVHVTAKKSRTTRVAEEGERLPHRSRPGTAANREIMRFQKQTGYYLAAPRMPLVRLLRKNASKSEHKMSTSAVSAIHFYIEDYINKLFLKSNEVARHAGRPTIKPKDINFAIKNLVNHCE